MEFLGARKNVPNLNPQSAIVARLRHRCDPAVVGFADRIQRCRHRLLEGGVAFPMLAAIMGWSPATTARMAKRYGHVSMEAKKRAVGLLDAPVSEGDSPQISPQSEKIAPLAAPN